jgi:putative endonuclease
MFYVYIIETECHPRRRYTGFTNDLKTRMRCHNSGGNISTAAARPWRLLAYFAFRSEWVAKAFELYLKSGSGKTFAKRHFLRR